MSDKRRIDSELNPDVCISLLLFFSFIHFYLLVLMRTGGKGAEISDDQAYYQETDCSDLQSDKVCMAQQKHSKFGSI